MRTGQSSGFTGAYEYSDAKLEAILRLPEQNFARISMIT